MNSVVRCLFCSIAVYASAVHCTALLCSALYFTVMYCVVDCNYQICYYIPYLPLFTLHPLPLTLTQPRLITDLFSMIPPTNHPTPTHDDPFFAPSGGDESGCVKPWLGAVKTPKNPPPINPGVPAVTMDLKWVHGYASGIE
jgi:hypothetical protein